MTKPVNLDRDAINKYHEQKIKMKCIHYIKPILSILCFHCFFLLRIMQILSNSHCLFPPKRYNRQIFQQWKGECFQHSSFVSLHVADTNMHTFNTNCSVTDCFLPNCILTQIYQQWKEKCFQRPCFVYIYFKFNFTITWPQPAGLEAWTSPIFPAVTQNGPEEKKKVDGDLVRTSGIPSLCL